MNVRRMKAYDKTTKPTAEPFSRQPLEDEYISETDGLIYCSKCHTPRQKKIEFLGKIMFPIIRCQCQQEQYEKEEAKRKHQEFLEHISRLKSSGLQDPALREFTFAHDNGINPEIENGKKIMLLTGRK